MFRFLLLFSVCLTTAGHAADLNPEAAVAHALAHNRDLVAARHRIAEAEGRLLHSGRAASPELEAEIKPNAEGREFSAGVGVAQKIALGGRLRLEKQVSRTEVEVARLEVREAEHAVATQVRMLATKLLDLDARRAWQKRRAEHSRELAGVSARAAAAGEASPLAAAEWELDSAEVEVRLLQMESEATGLLGALKPLLGMSVDEPLSIRGALVEPSAAPDGLESDASERALIRAARARLDATRQNVDLQRASKWEDLTVSVGYEREHVEDAGYGLRKDNLLGIKLSVPLPLGKNNLSHVREAEAMALRREAEVRAVVAGMQAEAAAARAEMIAASRLHAEVSGPLLSKARQLEDRHLAAYQAGQAPLTDVLRSRERRFALEAAALDARRDFNLALVRYRAARGR